MYHKTKSYRVFYVFNLTFLLVTSLVCLLPIIHVLSVSLSSASAAGANMVSLWPVGFTLESYKQTLGNSAYISAFGISAIRVVLSVSLGMLVTVLTAYPLSKIDSGGLKGGKFFAWYFVFTMLFSGGLIPAYILIQRLGLMNSIWALVLPGLVVSWNIILMLNFFRTIPRELEEASLMDGGGHLTTLFRIYVPVSLPAIATISLFIAVGQWNAWFDGLIYISEQHKWPMSTMLQALIALPLQSNLGTITGEDAANFSERTIKSAKIFIGALPILAVYPFLQRFFINGIVVGAVKE
ncbi:carbohydrate ABC transporter permease [Cohnella sp. JJ-181]|uniref:carbohydrate ABC transporter permease n=1 Tax=Cohnella rhizoplanae TaxID=2974897 RepID=UPI00232B5F00|nr:carbohydrate ABC transporter permease [Cohnella sp. JJ-181]